MLKKLILPAVAVLLGLTAPAAVNASTIYFDLAGISVSGGTSTWTYDIDLAGATLSGSKTDVAELVDFEGLTGTPTYSAIGGQTFSVATEGLESSLFTNASINTDSAAVPNILLTYTGSGITAGSLLTLGTLTATSNVLKESTYNYHALSLDYQTSNGVQEQEATQTIVPSSLGSPIPTPMPASAGAGVVILGLLGLGTVAKRKFAVRA